MYSFEFKLGRSLMDYYYGTGIAWVHVAGPPLQQLTMEMIAGIEQ